MAYQSLISSFPGIQNRKALVTGGTSGIGRALAYALANAGAKVVIVGRNKDALNTIDSHAKSLDISLRGVQGNLSDLDSIPEIAKECANIYGPFNILINAAGINLREHSSDISFESWEQTIRINLSAPFFLARELSHHMKSERWGKIINIASLQAKLALPNSMAYGASKGGIDQLTRAMAEEWSPFGICCNSIAPGFFHTPLTDTVFKDNKAEKLSERTALGRNGNLDDLEGPALFLASSASDYITGQTLYVDGGFTIK